MMERLPVDCGRKTKCSLIVWACPQGNTSEMEPHNTVWRAHSLFEHTDVTVMYDNETL